MNQRSMSAAATREHGLFARAAKVALLLALCYVAVAGPAYGVSGPLGLAAAGIAALVCAFASLGASVAAHLFQRDGKVVAGTVLAMLLRMAFPLVFAMIVYRQPGPLVSAGMIYYLISFYLVALAAETWFSVGQIQSGAAVSRGT